MDNSSITEELPLVQQRQLDTPGDALNSSAGKQHDEKAPYATRLRVILLLSIACWIVIAIGVAWLVD